MRWTDGARTILDRAAGLLKPAIVIAVLAGRVAAQPVPFDVAQGTPLTILDVPFISQSEALCGGAAAAMVLRYWGERGLTAESFAHLVDRSAAGIRTDALLNELRSRGWNALAVDGTEDAIDRELRLGRPVLTLIEDRPSRYHYVVVVATTPEAVVFHDPARAPLRVTGRAEFTRRWQAARKWMAIVLPQNRERELAASATIPSGAATPCDRLIADGVSQAQAGDLDGAERSLTQALSCGGATAMRELAGVRVLQRRWADVEALSTTATAIDPTEPYGWRLLGTSRFVQNNRAGALAAWNQAGEPRLDIVSIAGLERTRQRIVEGLVDARTGALVTPDLMTRSERRLHELPAAASASIELRPLPGGLAELRATIDERPVVPRDVWSYAAIGALAASRREVQLSTGSPTGGGESLRSEWRFWRGRQRVAVAFDAPAPWGGVWGAGGFGEREQFTAGLDPVNRSGGFAEWSNWVSATMRVSLGGGIEDWDQTGMLGRWHGGFQFLTPGGRVRFEGDAELWGGSASFARSAAAITAVSSTARTGRVYTGRAGAATGSSRIPPLLWFAGDTGQTRETLLRAHPLVDDGRLRIEQMGRALLHASAEAQQWWSVGLVQTAAAVFVDTARIGRQFDSGHRGDVDAGVGLRIGVPGGGLLRADVATALGHGGTRWSIVYEP